MSGQQLMENSSNSIAELNLKKTYEFVFRDIKVEMTEEEARQVKDLFVRMFPEINASPIPAKTSPSLRWKLSQMYDKKIYSSSKKTKLVPPEYFEITRRNSEQINGTPTHVFIYYKDSLGNYGYKVTNDKDRPFSPLGKVDDPNSKIGKFYTRLPTGDIVIKRELAKKRFADSTSLKALLDILEIENYITKVPSANDRRRSPGYYKPKKNEEGVGLDNNHGLQKVQVISQSPK